MVTAPDVGWEEARELGRIRNGNKSTYGRWVLSDETLRVGANAAGARVFSVLSGMRMLLVGHVSTGVFARPFIY